MLTYRDGGGIKIDMTISKYIGKLM